MTRTLPWLKDTSTTVARSSQPFSPNTPRLKRRRFLEPNPDVDEGSGGELTRRKSPNLQCRYGLSLMNYLLIAEIILKQLPLRRPLFQSQKGRSGPLSILDMTN
jgi:hypothetical protein